MCQDALTITFCNVLTLASQSNSHGADKLQVCVTCGSLMSPGETRTQTK